MADTLLSFSIQDSDGDTKRVPVFLPAATTQANIATFAASYAALLDLVIDGLIVEMDYTISLALPGGLKSSIPNPTEVQRGALYSFNNASRYKWGLYVPTWKEANFSGDAIATATEIDDLTDAYVSGLAGTNPTNGYAFDLTGIASSRKAFRK